MCWTEASMLGGPPAPSNLALFIGSMAYGHDHHSPTPLRSLVNESGPGEG
jgi:hypothetical protein